MNMKRWHRVLGSLIVLLLCSAVLGAAPKVNFTYQTIKGVVMNPSKGQLATLQAQAKAGKIVIQNSEYDPKAWYVLTVPKPISSTDELKAALSPGGDITKYQPTDRNESLVGAFEAGRSPNTAAAMNASTNTAENINLFNDRGFADKYPAVANELTSYNSGDGTGVDGIQISTADTSGGREEGAWTFGHEVGGHGTFKTILKGFEPETDYDASGHHDLNEVISGNAANFEGWANYQGFQQVDPNAKNADGTPMTYTPDGFRNILNGNDPKYQGIIDRDGNKIADNLNDPKLTFDQTMRVEAVNALIYNTLGEKVGHNTLLDFASKQDKTLADNPGRQGQLDTLKNFIKEHPDKADQVIDAIYQETNGKATKEEIRNALGAPSSTAAASDTGAGADSPAAAGPGAADETEPGAGDSGKVTAGAPSNTGPTEILPSDSELVEEDKTGGAGTGSPSSDGAGNGQTLAGDGGLAGSDDPGTPGSGAQEGGDSGVSPDEASGAGQSGSGDEGSADADSGTLGESVSLADSGAMDFASLVDDVREIIDDVTDDVERENGLDVPEDDSSGNDGSGVGDSGEGSDEADSGSDEVGSDDQGGSGDDSGAEAGSGDEGAPSDEGASGSDGSSDAGSEAGAGSDSGSDTGSDSGSDSGSEG
ncbi:MAG: hypothetical protein GX442_24655 [Candidatus Riflebacteria bacterium]|nr:hypothetical protein [Candidatus Riflebacteria bacterium]